MIFTAFGKALGQIGDSRFRRVLGLGVLLSLALLVAAYAAFLQLVWWLTPDSIDIPIVGPIVGPIEGLETLLGWASIGIMILLSVFLMVPVASAFTGLFLEDVAAAVEVRHYPRLRIPVALPLGLQIRQTVNFLGLVVAANTGLLLLVPFVGPLIPLVFWAVNGFLLGQEYFTLVGLRWMPPNEVKALWRRNLGTLWAAGVLLAAPLSLPLVNLLIPVLGVATFTHLFHRLALAGR